MPRLRNSASGAVMHVSEVTAERLGSGWVPIAPPKPDDKPKAKSKSD